MDQYKLKPKVGDRVIISRSTTTQRYAARVEQFSTVAAVRLKSFDAGGLCFRNDGREWNGHNRIRLILSGGANKEKVSLSEVEQSSHIERVTEDATLAFLLSSRLEIDWLKLGIHELRRIAELHGIRPQHTQPLEAINVDAQS